MLSCLSKKASKEGQALNTFSGTTFAYIMFVNSTSINSGRHFDSEPAQLNVSYLAFSILVRELQDSLLSSIRSLALEKVFKKPLTGL